MQLNVVYYNSKAQCVHNACVSAVSEERNELLLNVVAIAAARRPYVSVFCREIECNIIMNQARALNCIRIYSYLANRLNVERLIGWLYFWGNAVVHWVLYTLWSMNQTQMQMKVFGASRIVPIESFAMPINTQMHSTRASVLHGCVCVSVIERDWFDARGAYYIVAYCIAMAKTFIHVCTVQLIAKYVNGFSLSEIVHFGIDCCHMGKQELKPNNNNQPFILLSNEEKTTEDLYFLPQLTYLTSQYHCDTHQIHTVWNHRREINTINWSHFMIDHNTHTHTQTVGKHCQFGTLYIIGTFSSIFSVVCY